MLKLKDCMKVYTMDQDKAVPPAETVARVKARLEEKCSGVLEETKRVDTGRLGIPVFLSICGPAARAIMPTRKQMGKGASPDQAEASALMELVERFSYFSFWADEGNFTLATWSEAEARFGAQLINRPDLPVRGRRAHPARRASAHGSGALALLPGAERGHGRNLHAAPGLVQDLKRVQRLLRWQHP